MEANSGHLFSSSSLFFVFYVGLTDARSCSCEVEKCKCDLSVLPRQRAQTHALPRGCEKALQGVTKLICSDNDRCGISLVLSLPRVAKKLRLHVGLRVLSVRVRVAKSSPCDPLVPSSSPSHSPSSAVRLAKMFNAICINYVNRTGAKASGTLCTLLTLPAYTAGGTPGSRVRSYALQESLRLSRSAE